MKLLFTDTETGGLNPKVNAILSVGMAVWDNGIIDTTEIFIKGHPRLCDPEAMKINGINLIEHNKTALPEDEAVKAIQDFITKNYGDWHSPKYTLATLAGWNSHFDAEFLQELFDRHLTVSVGAREPSVFNFQVKKMTYEVSTEVALLAAVGRCKPAQSLSYACKEFGIVNQRAHSALSDTLATVRVHEAVLGRL